jgi:hypothetical protein
MQICIRLQDTLRPFRYDDVQKLFIDGNFLCVLCADDVINRFPLEDVIKFYETNGELPLDATSARFRVKIWPKKSSDHDFFYAGSTDEFGPFYRVTGRGNVVCYHRSTISFVQEEPIVKSERKPASGLVPVLDFFRGALVDLQVFEVHPPIMPEKCGVAHLQQLCKEALDNNQRYPSDKLCRWMGFAGGVLSTLDKRLEFSLYTGLVKGDLTSAAQNVLSKLFDRYLGIISKISIDAPLRKELKPIEIMIYDSLEVIEDCDLESQSIRLGYVQGVLAAKGLISVDEERAFSRPLLHSLHDQPIASFP